jgi:hypothetical protein
MTRIRRFFGLCEHSNRIMRRDRKQRMGTACLDCGRHLGASFVWWMLCHNGIAPSLLAKRGESR